MVSFDLGGEKLNVIRLKNFSLLIAVILTFITVFSYAQESEAEISAEIPAETPIVNYEEPIIFSDAASTETLDTAGSSLWIVFRMVLILALAALAIYGVVFFIKRLARPPQTRDPYLKILATVPIGTDTFAAVISVGTKAWLVGGGSAAGLSLISEITDQETVESMLMDEARKSAESGNRILDFRSLLDRFGGKAPPLQEGIDSNAQSIRRHRERLERPEQ